MSEVLSRRPPPPLPVTILTGFLGAGKTTLLNRLLADPALSSCLVLVNELGDVALDHLFMEKIDGDVVLLSSGCLCCSLRGDLVSALEDLIRRRDNARVRPFDRVVIETTGLADPAPILQALMSHPYLVLRYRLDGIVCVVDAVNGVDTLSRHREARRQVAAADRIVVSKTDMKESPATLTVLTRELEKLNFGAPKMNIDQATVDALLNVGLFDPTKKRLNVAGWLRAEGQRNPDADAASNNHASHEHKHHPDPGSHPHEQAIGSFTIIRETPLEPHSLQLFLSALLAAHGAKILRIKGLIALSDDKSRPWVVHGAQHLLHPPVRLDVWPDEDHRTRIVFIVDGLSQDFIEKFFAAACNETRIDGPDAEALRSNPLIIRAGGLLG